MINVNRDIDKMSKPDKKILFKALAILAIGEMLAGLSALSARNAPGFEGLGATFMAFALTAGTPIIVLVFAGVSFRKLKKSGVETHALANLSILFLSGVLFAYAVIAFPNLVAFIKSPALNSTRIETAKLATADEINGFLEDIRNDMEWTHLASGTHDKCFPESLGSTHNTCAYKRTDYLGSNGDFREDIVKLKQFLSENEWEDRLPGGGALERVIRQYDSFYGREYEYNSYYDRLKGIENLTNRRYLVSDMGGVINIIRKEGPEGKYTKYLESYNLQLRYVEERTEDAESLDDFYGIQRIIFSKLGGQEDKQFIDVYELFEKNAQQYEYLIAVSIEKPYFDN